MASNSKLEQGVQLQVEALDVLGEPTSSVDWMEMPLSILTQSG